MKKIEFNSKVIVLHIINWLLVIVMRNIIIPLEDEWLYLIIRPIIDLSIYSSGYYFFCIIISPFIETRNWKRYLPLIIAYLVIWIYLILLSDRIINMFYYNDFSFYETNAGELSWASVYAILIAMMSHSFYQKQISIQKLNAQSEKEQIGLIQETLFFKNQFNSHISLNFLSYCYSHALQKDQSTSNAIETYSEMMKYTLQTEAKEEVPLKKEIAYIEQFILLQKQLGKEIHVKFLKNDNVTSISILPRILINYVENAFKYGISDEADKPISIKLETMNKYLYFSISNYKKESSESLPSTKKGQYNSKQQLELFYPNKYHLEVTDTKMTYTASLKIKII